MSEKEDKKATLVSLEEDDEFEDFPVEGELNRGWFWDRLLMVDWKEADAATEVKQSLWEEQWDDDDGTDENFAAQLR